MPIDVAILERLRDNDESLTQLDLSNKQLTDADIENLCNALVNNTSLRSLYLNNNQITNKGAKLLNANTQLTTINLDNNPIDHKNREDVLARLERNQLSIDSHPPAPSTTSGTNNHHVDTTSNAIVLHDPNELSVVTFRVGPGKARSLQLLKLHENLAIKAAKCQDINVLKVLLWNNSPHNDQSNHEELTWQTLPNIRKLIDPHCDEIKFEGKTKTEITSFTNAELNNIPSNVYILEIQAEIERLGLLNAAISIETTDERGYTLLFLAAKENNNPNFKNIINRIKTIEFLLKDHKANVWARDPEDKENPTLFHLFNRQKHCKYVFLHTLYEYAHQQCPDVALLQNTLDTLLPTFSSLSLRAKNEISSILQGYQEELSFLEQLKIRLYPETHQEKLDENSAVIHYKEAMPYVVAYHDIDLLFILIRELSFPHRHGFFSNTLHDTLTKIVERYEPLISLELPPRELLYLDGLSIQTPALRRLQMITDELAIAKTTNTELLHAIERETEEVSELQHALAREVSAFQAVTAKAHETLDTEKNIFENDRSAFIAREAALLSKLKKITTELENTKAQRQAREQEISIIHQNIIILGQRLADAENLVVVKDREAAELDMEMRNLQQNTQHTKQELTLLETRAKLLFHEKTLMLNENQELSQQCSSLQTRLQTIETEHKNIEKQQRENIEHGLGALQAQFDDLQIELALREKEWQERAALAQVTEKTLVEAKDNVAHQADILKLQLDIFQKYGLPPEERAFQSFLRDIKRMLLRSAIPAPTCYISYAWEDVETANGKEANHALQGYLRRLVRDLKELGVTSYLDIENLTGNIFEWMTGNIASCDYILLIGTERFKTRIQNSSTNVGKEWLATKEKINQNHNTVIPLLYQGDFKAAFPDEISQSLIRDCRTSENYFDFMAQMISPMSFIRSLFGICHGGPNASLQDEYHTYSEKLDDKLKQIKQELEFNQLALASKNPNIEQRRSTTPREVGSSFPGTYNPQFLLFAQSQEEKNLKKHIEMHEQLKEMQKLAHAMESRQQEALKQIQEAQKQQKEALKQQKEVRDQFEKLKLLTQIVDFRRQSFQDANNTKNNNVESTSSIRPLENITPLPNTSMTLTPIITSPLFQSENQGTQTATSPQQQTQHSSTTSAYQQPGRQ